MKDMNLIEWEVGIMSIEETLRLIANPYKEAKISIMHSSSGFDGFMHFYNGILKKCSDFSLIELLIKVDSNNDMNLYEDLLREKNIKYKFLVYPVLNLRHSMHLFFNDLSSIASTNLIWIVSEDTVIKHGDWLKEILVINDILENKYADGIYCIGMHMETDGGKVCRIGTMQIMSKKMLNAIGQYSPYPNSDRWMHDLSDGINRMDKIDKNKLSLFAPKGRRTFSKNDKKYIFKPVVKKAIKKLKKKLK